MKKKHIALLLTCVMMLGVAIGGTLAWLADESDPVTNVFTSSDINVELDESDDLDLKMIPGWDIAKDPEVTVLANSEACYVFVKIEKSENYDSYLEEYSVDAAWTRLTDADETDNVIVGDVFYQKVTKQSADWSDYVLAGKDGFTNGYVTVKEGVTKDMMEAIDGLDAGGNVSESEIKDRPTLTFTAYASQLMESNGVEFEPYEAWVNVSNPTGA